MCGIPDWIVRKRIEVESRNVKDFPDSNHETVVAETAKIESNLVGRLRGFHVVMRDGGLILRGRSPSYYVKQLAQHAVMSVSPIPLVANEIEVA